MLSVYVRTDPRDPANRATPPGWLVELRNGFREVSRTVEEADARGQRLALPDLRERVERELVAPGRPSGPRAGLVYHGGRCCGSAVHAAVAAPRHVGPLG